jgi:Fic family protein
MAGRPRFDRRRPHDSLPKLPPRQGLETPRVLKAVIAASRALAEFKGIGLAVPGSTQALVRSIAVQEAKSSSEIEAIVTTNDALYQAVGSADAARDPVVKEVVNYLDAVWLGHRRLRAGRRLDRALFVELASVVRGEPVEVRRGPGTRVGNPVTGEVLYTPPQGAETIDALLDDLAAYYAMDDGVDPLVKMAVAHYQFEAVHPFRDGNGRTGRILNVLYLVQQGLLAEPVLFLSRAIIETKAEYYARLLAVTEEGAWEDWVLYMLGAVARSGRAFGEMLGQIPPAIEDASEVARADMRTGYSDALLRLVFQQPATRIAHVVEAGIAKRRTASLQLRELERIGILESVKRGRDVLYINRRLIDILGGGAQ